MKPTFVSNSQESTRMFDDNFREAFSKTHFAVPLFLFVPVVGYFLYATFFVYHLAILPSILFFAGGILIWSLTEYLMHRFLFHYSPTSDWGKRIHFVFHGVHHDYPNDAKRLVMAPSVSIPLAFLYYYMFRMILGESNVAPFFSGFVTGYLFYDMTHYA
ncbi:MAG: sterol desaturase family protein, partial [Bacteroidia bacterium]